MKTTIVIVGSSNPTKVSAVQDAFKRYFQYVDITGYKVSSRVPEQPIDGDVFRGAENRLKELKKSAENYDFLVACEGGLICQNGHWFNVQVIAIENRQGKMGFGISQGYEIPEQYVKEAIDTNIADTLDRIFNGKGGIRILTRNQFTRSKLIEDGTIMALTRVLNEKNW